MELSYLISIVNQNDPLTVEEYLEIENETDSRWVITEW